MFSVPQLHLSEGVGAHDRRVTEKLDIPDEGAPRFEVVQGDTKEAPPILDVVLANDAVSSSPGHMLSAGVPR